jgi:uncharacterized lipoprotein YehR (DUF1307 family)
MNSAKNKFKKISIVIFSTIVSVTVTGCTTSKTLWLYSKIDIPYDLTKHTSQQSIAVNDPSIILKYIKSSNLKADKKSYAMNGVDQLVRENYLNDKALQQCNLKIEYIRKYIDKYNDVLDKIASN